MLQIDSVAGKVDSAAGRIGTLFGKVRSATGRIRSAAGKMDTCFGKIRSAAGKTNTSIGIRGSVVFYWFAVGVSLMTKMAGLSTLLVASGLVG